MKKSHFILIAVMASVFLGPLAGQIESKKIDQLMVQALSKFGVAGASLAIVKDGKIIHSQGYGVKSILTQEKITKDTPFAIASNSKAFTSAALAILIDEGKLSWQDLVKDHIPEFKMYNAYVTENFNIEDLLTHRSGLGLGVGDLMFFPDGSDFTIHDVVTCFQHFKPQSAFRTKFDYDNLLYMVAGEIVKRVSGQSWEDFVEERILRPLGMKNSYTGIGRVPQLGILATPHSDESGSLKPLEHFVMDPHKINGAPGGILASVQDLSQWMLVQLNGGRYGQDGKKRLFSKARQNEMWQIHTVMRSNPSPQYKSHCRGYGLGWGLSDMRGNLVVSHTGGLPGMLSKTILIPDLNLGIVLLTNTSNGGGGLFESVTRTIVDSYLGLEDFGWIEKFAAATQRRASHGDAVSARVWQTVEKAKNTEIVHENFVGTYADKWFGKIEVFMKGKRMWIKCLRSPKLNGAMQFYKANTFAVKWEYQDMVADAFVSFMLDEEGKAQGFKMKGISPNIDFSFDFHDLDLKRIQPK